MPQVRLFSYAVSYFSKRKFVTAVKVCASKMRVSNVKEEEERQRAATQMLIMSRNGPCMENSRQYNNDSWACVYM